MKIISGIVDEVYFLKRGIGCFYEIGNGFSVRFDVHLNPVKHICKEVKRK